MRRIRSQQQLRGRRAALLPTLALLFAAGCVNTPGAAHEAVNQEVLPPNLLMNFSYSHVGITVVDDSDRALSNVHVQLTRVSSAADGRLARDLVWEGRTNDAGQVQVDTTVVNSATDFELMLNLSGYEGEYTEESRRVAAGDWASSSVISLSRSQLSDVFVVLTPTNEEGGQS